MGSKVGEYRRNASEARHQALAATNKETAELFGWIAEQWDLLAVEHLKLTVLMHALDVAEAERLDGSNPPPIKTPKDGT